MSLKKATFLGSNLASLNQKVLKLHTVYAVILDAIKPLQLVGQAAQFKLSPSSSSCRSSGISPKAVPEGNRRFRGQNQRPSSWGSSPALLARVGRASTKTQGVSESARCGLQPARLRKICYHSCDTDSVQEPIRF